MIKKIQCYELKGSKKQLEEMEHIMEYETYRRDQKAPKYFNIWISLYGLMVFPRKEYFVSRNGNSNYEECLKEYRGY